MRNTKLYIAYGSNLNIEQMLHRCPTARIVGSGILPDYKLVFSRVASIIPEERSFVPCGVWEIDYHCEKALDHYEGFPWLYHKETLSAIFDGKPVAAMAYIMNHIEISPPSYSYYRVIEDGYTDFGLDHDSLVKALNEAQAVKNAIGKSTIMAEGR